ncbi:hypothetical protein LCGC14_2021030 [marine sediment metagenome]|uniref:Uncharacterized protein n=1 Tax=marine sediment metagenome TaxID=412755 RepID=A0A0F9EXM1_9ZZZZ
MVNDTKVIKLISGEELIAQIDIVDQTVILHNPVKIVITSEGQMAMASWIIFSEDKQYIIPKSQILCMAIPQSEILNAYNSKFGSGIITPPQSIIT